MVLNAKNEEEKNAHIHFLYYSFEFDKRKKVENSDYSNLLPAILLLFIKNQMLDLSDIVKKIIDKKAIGMTRRSVRYFNKFL